MTRLAGIDISGYQTVPDPIKMSSSNIAFCWIKATEGNTYHSPAFAGQHEAVGKSAALRGAYHFFMPGVGGEAQADYFASYTLASFAPGDLPPMIDVEAPLPAGVTAATAIKNLHDCISNIKDDFGVQPIIYTGYYYWTETLDNPAGFSASPLWLASYTAVPPTLPGNWAAMTLWQYTAPQNGKPNTGYPTTIFGNETIYIDGDYFYGSIDDLWNLASLTPIAQNPAYQPKVVALQTRLTAKGYDTLGADGIFGPYTAAALTAWQNANGLNAIGTINAEQWMLLFGINYV